MASQKLYHGSSFLSASSSVYYFTLLKVLGLDCDKKCMLLFSLQMAEPFEVGKLKDEGSLSTCHADFVGKVNKKACSYIRVSYQ